MRIIYGIGGEGKGHATRSAAAIEYLLAQGHDVRIYAGDHAYPYLKSRFRHVTHVQSSPLVYRKGRLALFRSTTHIARTVLPRVIPTIRKLFRFYKRFRPQVIITDFEFFTAWTGKMARIPVITANNISVIRMTRQRTPLYNVWHGLWTDFGERMGTFFPDAYVIPAYAPGPRRPKNVTVTAPVVRNAIREAKPTAKGAIVVYQTTSTNTRLLDTLEQVKEKFIIYGYPEQRNRKNLTFKPFSQTEFIHDFAAAKAAILGGGFSMVSEALYLKKPILSVPVRQHYEQYANAWTLEQKGFGMFRIDPTPEDVRAFIARLPSYRKRLAKYDFDPDEFPRAVESVARNLSREPSLRRLNAWKRVFFC